MSRYELVKWTPLSLHRFSLSGPLVAASVTNECRDARLQKALESGRRVSGIDHMALEPGRLFSALNSQ